MSSSVTVAEAIRDLRAQLEEAQREGADKTLRFTAKTIEVELNIVFKSEAGGGAALKAWFLDVSGTAKAAHETTHKVKLVLEPEGHLSMARPRPSRHR